MLIKHNGVEFSITDSAQIKRIMAVVTGVSNMGRPLEINDNEMPIVKRAYRKHRKYSQYSAEEIAHIKESKERGVSTVKIARDLKRTPRAVDNFIWRMNNPDYNKNYYQNKHAEQNHQEA